MSNMNRFMIASVWMGLALLATHTMAGDLQQVNIVIDSIHANNFIDPSFANVNRYHEAYGYRKIFNYLQSINNVHVTELTKGKLTPAILRPEQCQMLFINLVSADRPPFLVDEIAEIKKYIEEGGSLLLITDHTNCYYHTHQLLPLLNELGIESSSVTACDREPHVLGTGNAWIAVTRFTQHPVTAGIRLIGMQTAGTVDIKYAIAKTSDLAWPDAAIVHPFGEGDTPGNYGNWIQDDNEPTGELGVVLAKELGKGRIVITSDQNMFGDPFLQYADNFRLLLNSVAWLTGAPDLSNAKKYEAQFPTKILMYENPTNSTFGNNDKHGYFNLFASLSHNAGYFATPDLSKAYDLIVLAHDRYALKKEDQQDLIDQLRKGINVIVLEPITRDGCIQSLGKDLGEMQSDVNKDALIYTWTGMKGKVYAIRTGAYSNEFIAAPEKTPDTNQLARMDQLKKIIADGIKPTQ